MRPVPALLVLTSLITLAGCTGSLDVEIANNDSAGLLEALKQANATPGHDTIRLARNGLYILGTPAQPGLMMPPLDGKLTIEGNYAEVRGYADQPAALLEVGATGKVRIRNLLLAEGTDGAVRNFGELRLDNVAIVDSSVDKMAAIVLNHGHLVARDSEIAYNLLLATRRDSGTVLNYGDIELERSRIHDNRALGREPTLAASGGILNFGTVMADGLLLENNEMPAEDTPLLGFGGILNIGNGSVTGATATDGVRDARQAKAFTMF